jgi:hypothetical protein
LLGLFQGIESARIEDRKRLVPNQGIRRSWHNSARLALISTILIGVIGMLIDGLSGGLSTGLYRLNYGLSIGLHLWLSDGLILAVCGGLLVCASRGGLAVLRHGILRLLLRCAGVVPRHYVRFLDEAASCILLRKVGGGYSFIHRLLLDYFVELEKHDH